MPPQPCPVGRRRPSPWVPTNLLSLSPPPTPSAKTFLKAIPDLVSFCQAWIVYATLHVAASPDCTLSPALAGFLVHVAELDQHFDWTYIADYILTVVTGIGIPFSESGAFGE
ncbi:uncharacterized protein UHOD_11223 [Ustilago sp. UG-2017b]|nr:uncharacterized protein UHOD_11223 [Ustilago sp. UG-2017b]